MDTCGRQTQGPERSAEPRRWRCLIGAPLIALALVAGCATGPTEMGRPIPVDRLSQLKPGVSTLGEVIATLGEPQGRGGARLPAVPLHDLLLYEFDTMEGTNMRMKMLIVFITRPDNVYEGYLWFNSGLLISPGS